MGKILIFIFILNLFIASTFGISLEKFVPKIYSYEYNNITKVFKKVQYGSAIFFDNKYVLTNAHVVLDPETLIPFSNYEICKTYDFKKAPSCYTIGKLLYYDTKTDLAILRIYGEKTDSINLKAINTNINIGDLVEVYGYPSIGGNTITFTQGKISGYLNGFFKVDAVVDKGNSGGGVFNKKGELIGMVTAISYENSVLGYIIPIDKILNFLQKKGDITYVNSKINSNFYKYIKEKNKQIQNGYISNIYFTMYGIKKYGYDIKGLNYDINKSLYSYILLSKSGKTSISIAIRKIIGKKYLDKILKFSGTKKNKNIRIITKKIKIKGKNGIIQIVLDKNKNIVIILSFQNLLYIIRGNLSNKKEIISAVRLFLKELKLKNRLFIPEKNMRIGGMNIKINNDNIYGFISLLDGDIVGSLYIAGLGKEMLIYPSFKTILNKDKLKEYEKLVKDDINNLKSILKERKNKNGIYYLANKENFVFIKSYKNTISTYNIKLSEDFTDKEYKYIEDNIIDNINIKGIDSLK